MSSTLSTTLPAASERRMFLMCYEDKFNYGWHHVDLFVHDDMGRELNWVHWTVEADGPDAADESVRREEPTLLRISEWEHRVSAFGMNYWMADASWPDADPSLPDATANNGTD